MPDLLIELFSEEIPARMQRKAEEDLKKRMMDGLVEAGLTYADAATFSTPRRLMLVVGNLTDKSPTVREERKGPRVDAPEKALEGFLRSTGLTKDQLEQREDKKGAVWFASVERPGRAAAEIVAEVLEDTIRNFPWPKSMRWGDGSLRWVRPLQSILCILYDDESSEVVPLEVDGIVSGDVTRGHRFMAPEPFSVKGYDGYSEKLEAAKVLLSADVRAAQIKHVALNATFAQGLELVEDDGLLREVAGLVEWPVVLMGEIDAEFLDLPAEVLQTSMREHQKFFSVRNPKTDRIERFITVANIETADSGATILAGNRKVLSARLADAKFFWENDLRVAKAGMQDWLTQLENVTFERRLGSQAERIKRIAALARELAPVVGADPDLAEQAAKVAKADLSSEMVYEFPELQGLMGRYYALEAGLPEDVAWAAEEHYAPLGPSDDVPSRPVSVTVALADKLDLLTGFWAIDEKPTGSKDPFALRRAALGVIRLVLENGLRVGVRSLARSHLMRPFVIVSGETGQGDGWGLGEQVDYQIEFFATMSGSGFGGGESEKASFWASEADELVQGLLSFFHDRLKVYLRDQGIRHDVIDACLDEGADDLARVAAQAKALSDVLATEDGENLVQGFKRANNILKQAEEKDGVEYSFGADVKFAETDEEKALFGALDTADQTIAAAIGAEDYAAAMAAMAMLRAPIDAFFEAVQINADNPVLRRNRLNLLSRIRQICNQAADLTRLDG